MEVARGFHWADYLVLSLMLLVSSGIGFYVAFRSGGPRTTSDYLMGGRKLQLFPVAMSILASFLSAVSVLGTPLEVYLYGASFLLYSLAFVISVPITAHVFIPLFYKLKLTSVYEYLELRFNRAIRLLGSIVFSLQMVFYMAIVLYAPALALSQVTNLSFTLSVFGIGVICTVYTALGGLRAVVYTDTFQVAVILLGVLALIIKGVIDVGGPGEVWRRAQAGGRLDDVINFDPSLTVRHTFWSLSIGGAFTTLSVYAINQALVQRYLAVSKLSYAQGTIYINLPGNAFMTTILGLLGLVAYARYQDCDPFIAGRIKAFDQIIPLMVMDVLGMYPGMPGLFLACVFSAALSTISSGVNALALVYLEDVARPAYSVFKQRDMTERTATLVSKLLAVAFGLITIALAYLTGTMDQTLVNITLKSFGMTGGPLLGLFVLAMFFPRANSWGAGVGLLCGLSFSFWVVIGGTVVGPKGSILSLVPCKSSNMSSFFSYNVTTPALSTSSDVTSALLSLTSQVSQTASIQGTSAQSDSILALYKLSYLWISLTSATVVIVLGLIVSYSTGCADDKVVNPDHIIPLWKTLKMCFIRHKKRYNVWKSQKKSQVVTKKDYKLSLEDG